MVHAMYFSQRHKVVLNGPFAVPALLHRSIRFWYLGIVQQARIALVKRFEASQPRPSQDGGSYVTSANWYSASYISRSRSWCLLQG